MIWQGENLVKFIIVKMTLKKQEGIKLRSSDPFENLQILTKLWDDEQRENPVDSAGKLLSPARVLEEAEYFTAANRLFIFTGYSELTDKKTPKPFRSRGNVIRLALAREVGETREKLLKKGEEQMLKAKFPTEISKENIEKALLSAQILWRISDAYRQNEDEFANIAINAASALQTNGAVQITQYACPEIWAQNINDKDAPESYIQQSAKEVKITRTTVGSQGRRMQEILKLFDILNIPVELNIVFGDDDEAAYLLPGFRDDLMETVTSKPFLDALEEQRIDLQRRVNKMEGLKGRTTVYSWRALNQTALPSYAPKDLKKELEDTRERLAENLENSFYNKIMEPEIKTIEAQLTSPTGFYGQAFGIPSKKQIEGITKRKVAWYAYQSAIIKSFWPFAIMAINEQPIAIRKAMIRAITGDSLAIATPYDIKEKEVSDE